MERREFMTGAAGVVVAGAVAGCTTDDESNPQEKNAGGDGTADNSGGGKEVEILSDEFVDEGEYEKYVQGTIENVSGSELEYAQVTVKFKGTDGARVGDGMSNTTDWPAGGKYDFKIDYLGDQPVDTYTIEAGTEADL